MDNSDSFIIIYDDRIKQFIDNFHINIYCTIFPSFAKNVYNTNDNFQL